MKKKILNFIYEGCSVAIWMGLFTMTYQLYIMIRNGMFSFQSNWSDLVLLIGIYVLWFFAWQWQPKNKKKDVEEFNQNESDDNLETQEESDKTVEITEDDSNVESSQEGETDEPKEADNSK